MRKAIQVAMIVLIFSFSQPLGAEELPDWVFKSCQKQGDIWYFSGSVYDISLLNVAIPLARNAALTNLVSNIGLAVNSAVRHTLEGSEVDGYTQTISVNNGYFLDRIVAYGVRQKEIYVERVNDYSTGRIKFNVHSLLEVTEVDLARAKEDFANHAYLQRAPKPVLKSKEEAGLFKRLIREVLL